MARTSVRRERMVNRDIRRRGILDGRVLEAMRRVPRHRFLPPRWRKHAYEDRALPLPEAQTISQPYMVAAMSAALRTRPGERVLEIGTGSGYQTAVLAELAREVYTIERLRGLSERARTLLGSLGYAKVRYLVGDGSKGWAEEAPFDAVVVTAGAPEAPKSLTGQLNPEGGRLVIPIGDWRSQELCRYVRWGDEIASEKLMECRFVPLLGAEGW